MKLSKLTGIIAVSSLLFIGLSLIIFGAVQFYASGGWLATWIYIVFVIGFISFYVWGFTHEP